MVVLFLFALLLMPKEEVERVVAGDSLLRGVHIIRYGAEGIRWEAEVEEARVTDTSGIARLKGVSLFYPAWSFRVEGEMGSYALTTGSLNLTGRIMAVGPDIRLTASEVSYDAQQRRLLLRGTLRVEGKRFIATADRGEILDTDIVRMYGNVRTVFRGT